MDGSSPTKRQPNASRKRLRVNAACTVCRNRKTRCDGRRPTCRACENRCVGTKCRYIDYETSVGDTQTQAPSQTPITPQRRAPPASTGNSNRLITPETLEKEGSDGFVDCRPWSATQSDGLGTFIGRHDTSVYGPSSTVAFLQEVVAEDREDHTTWADTSSRNLPSLLVPERPPIRSAAWSLLPRRRSADNFVACFWDFIHPVFPLLHKPTFMRQYEEFWAKEAQESGRGQLSPDEEMADAIFQSTLNLVFGVGCKLSDLVPDHEKAEASNRFYQASRQFILFDMLDSASLVIVQLLVLNGVYLQSTAHANRCWNSVGLGIRVAQGLGLHLEQCVAEMRSQVDREMSRRIWYTCVSLDRLLAMTFGRPAMIPKISTLALPEMIDDEYLLEDGLGEQPACVTPRLGLFVSSCRLFDVLAEVLEFLSHLKPLSKSTFSDPDTTSKLVNDILDLDRRLEMVWSSIPSYMQDSAQRGNTSSYPNHVRLQQQIFHCRFMLTRLLLLRPLLLRVAVRHPNTSPTALLESHQSNLDSIVASQSCELCIQTAFLLVDAIYENLHTLYRSSGWHAVYFTFSSAIVLLASLKCELLDGKFGDDAFETCWSRSIYILHHFEQQVHSAPHAVKVLQAIRRRVTRTSLPQKNQRPTASSHDSAVHEFEGSFSGLSDNRPSDASTVEGLTPSAWPDVFFGSDVTYTDWLDVFS